jgi:hypothetical protein
LKVSNIISAVYSLFSGVFNGGSVWCEEKKNKKKQKKERDERRTRQKEKKTNQKEIVLFRITAQVLVDTSLPVLLHVIPVFNQTVLKK